MAAAAAQVLGHPEEPGLAGGLVIAYPGSPAPSDSYSRDAFPPESGLRRAAGYAQLVRVVGGHPVPTAASEEAGGRAMALARSVDTNDRLLLLLSGGASSLMAVPSDGLSLEDKRSTTAILLEAGADIHSLNTVRKHLSAIKGGRLAAATRGTCEVFVVSDVVGDDLGVIASGPAVADTSHFSDALDILRRFGGEDRFPHAVVQHLRTGAEGRIAETPKPGDPRLAHTRASVIGSRRDAMDGAVAEAARRGYWTLLLDDAVVGEARLAAPSHLREVAGRAGAMKRPLCVVSSGETTVRVTGHGRGGRNQEFVLAAAEVLAQIPSAVTLASAGTDGIDGPTDAAGAYADWTTVSRALAAGRRPGPYLADNNSYAFFDALGDLQVILLA